MSVLDILKEQKPPDDLFHYTTQEGLLGIIRNRNLRATKVICLNDASEFQLALKLAKEILTNFKNEEESIIFKIDKLREEIDSIQMLNIFVSSFSKNGDQLSQWRAYGNPSGGYAIGFHGPKLFVEAKKQGFFMAQCEYREEKQKEYITSLIEKYLSKDLNAFGVDKVDKKTRTIKIAAFTDFWKELSSLAPIIKHKGFYEEEEWRIITESAMSSSKVSYREGSTYIIPFCEFSFNFPEQLIKSITIGPTPHREISKNALRMFLQKHGLSIEIKFTEIPYRNW